VASISKLVLVPYTPEEMFALVSDIESYPEFLPWCKASRIVSRNADEVRASLDLSKGGVEKSFTTSNRHQINKMIEIRLVEGPFRCLEGFWRFDALGGVGCKVSLDLEYEFANRMLSMMVGPVFHQIANTLVDSFQKRAVDVYGKR
jgi:ribosome-associated toxin RatA of RatAB toxin-antitoxin module